MSNLIGKRQDWHNSYDDDYDDDGSWWGYSDTGTAVKWAIVGLILLVIFMWLLGGYYHAQRRIRRNQPPLAYHKFLVPRHQRARFQPQPPFTFYQHQGYGQEYPMHAYPPPAYNAHQPPPPTYQAPEGNSKVNPEQSHPAPPSGPSPPGQSNAGESSSGMQDVPLHHRVYQGQEQRPHIGETKPKPGFVSRLNPFKGGSQ